MSSGSLSSYLPNDEDSFMLQLTASGSNLLLEEVDDFRFLDDNSGFGTPMVPAKKESAALTLQELTPRPAPLSPTRRLNSTMKQQRVEQVSPLKAALTRQRERDLVEDVIMNSPARFDILKADLDEFAREDEMISEEHEMMDETPEEPLAENTQQRVVEPPIPEMTSSQPLPQLSVILGAEDEEDASFMNSVAARRLLEYGQLYSDPTSTEPNVLSSHSTPPFEEEVVISRTEEQSAPEPLQMEIERDDSPLTISQLSPSKTRPTVATPKKLQSHTPRSKGPRRATDIMQSDVAPPAFSPMKPASKRTATPSRDEPFGRRKLPKRTSNTPKEPADDANESSSVPVPQLVAESVSEASALEDSTSMPPGTLTTTQSRKIVALPSKTHGRLSSKPRIFPKSNVASSRNSVALPQPQPVQRTNAKQLGKDIASMISTEQIPAKVTVSIDHTQPLGSQDESRTLSTAVVSPSAIPTSPGSLSEHVSRSIKPDACTTPEQEKVLANLLEPCEDHASATNTNVATSEYMDVEADVVPRVFPVPVSTALAPVASTDGSDAIQSNPTIATKKKKASTRSRNHIITGATHINKSRQSVQKSIRERGLAVRKRSGIQSRGVTKVRQKNHQDSRTKPQSSRLVSDSLHVTGTSVVDRSYPHLGASTSEDGASDSSSTPIVKSDSGELNAFETSTYSSRDLPSNSSSGTKGIQMGGQFHEAHGQRIVDKVIDLNVGTREDLPSPGIKEIGNTKVLKKETQLPTQHAGVTLTSGNEPTTYSRKPVPSKTESLVASSSSCSALSSSSRTSHDAAEGNCHLRSSSRSSQHIGSLTKPIVFHFASDKRLEERRTLHASSSTLASSSSSSSSSHVHPVPDFKSIHALNASLLASRREKNRPAPLVPAPFSSHLDERIKTRRAFDEQIRQRQEELEREMAERKKEEERKAEEEIKELRKQANPKANPVPEWYKDAPKRKKT